MFRNKEAKLLVPKEFCHPPSEHEGAMTVACQAEFEVVSPAPCRRA